MFNIPQPWSAILFWIAFGLLPLGMLYGIIAARRRERVRRQSRPRHNSN